MEYTRDQLALIMLAGVPGIGVRRASALLAMVDSPEELFDLRGSAVQDMLGQKQAAEFLRLATVGYAEDITARMEKLGIRALCRFTPGYPSRFADVFDPPYVLFVKGAMELPRERLLAIVGSRRCSRYGASAACSFAEEAARQGVTVISGMARGIDSCAHTGALRAGGKTIAVLGCGLDVCYPPENVELFEQITENGLLISEYVPGVAPLPANFRLRNRIIAALCEAVLLVEGAKGSGAMITVDCAMDISREIFAIPGQVDMPLSFCPNALIRDGAHVALSAADILETMGWPTARRERELRVRNVAVDLDGDERMIAELLLVEDLSFEQLLEKTSISVEKLNSLLTMMTLRGIINQHSGRVYSL